MHISVLGHNLQGKQGLSVNGDESVGQIQRTHPRRVMDISYQRLVWLCAGPFLQCDKTDEWHLGVYGVRARVVCPARFNPLSITSSIYRADNGRRK